MARTYTEEFSLSDLYAQADDAMLDQAFFVLKADAFEKFQEMLDAPSAPNERLRRFLSSRPIWNHENKR